MNTKIDIKDTNFDKENPLEEMQDCLLSYFMYTSQNLMSSQNEIERTSDTKALTPKR